jgi:hypothetical protein
MRWGRRRTATREADSPPLNARVAVGARAAATAYGWWSGKGDEQLCWCWWRTADGKCGGKATATKRRRLAWCGGERPLKT